MRAFVVIAALSVGVVMGTRTPAAAQAADIGVGVAGEFGFEVNDQVSNAVRAVEDVLKAYRTGGESVRGASGPLASLLINSGKLICNTWMMNFHSAMTQLASEGALNSPEGTEVIMALNRLKSRVEEECNKAMNGGPRIGVIGGGEGSEPTNELVPNTCPNCPYELRAREIAKWRLAAAQYRAERARERTSLLAQMWLANAAAMRRLQEETIEEAERFEARMADEFGKAREALAAAEKAYIDCIEACHKQLRDQYGFLDRHKKVLIIGAAAAIASVALIGGGGGTPTTLVSTPPAQPVATTPVTPPANTPVVSSPPPTPQTLLALIVGRWVCAACRVLNDPDRHENTLRFCAQMIAIFQLLANSPLRIEHPAPWVTVSGELDESTGTYRATGTGRVGGFSNVSSTVTATFQRTGDSVNAVDLTVTLGENGVFPGGRPVTYSVRLTKAP